MSFDETGWLRVVAIRSRTEHQSMNDLLKVSEWASYLAIAIVKSRIMIFMSDDRTARCVANGIGVSISGTVGILVRCMDKDIISFLEGNIILAGMIQKGYMSPVDGLEAIASPD